ncbi:galactose-1-epimerase, partial [Parapusillimonas sp. SGNA-6]|nr:galactose-1-epimerase [Parapusillimonas sp. SGNA-6]
MSSFAIFLSIGMWSCQQSSTSNKEKTQELVSLPDSVQFRDTIKGEEVSLYTLRNKNGMEVALTNFGARIVSLLVHDKDGVCRDVVLGFSKAADYHNPTE